MIPFTSATLGPVKDHHGSMTVQAQLPRHTGMKQALDKIAVLGYEGQPVGIDLLGSSHDVVRNPFTRSRDLPNIE